MKTTTLLRNLSFCSRRLRLFPFNPNNPIIRTPPSLLSLSASTRSIPSRFFSSRNNESHFTQTQKQDAPVDADDVSNEELKKRIAKLREGDAEAIPSVFEAILQRYLSGKPIEGDQELMREILGKGEEGSDDDDDGDEELELDSDLEGMSETDDDEEQDFDLDFEGRGGTDEEKTKR